MQKAQVQHGKATLTTTMNKTDEEQFKAADKTKKAADSNRARDALAKRKQERMEASSVSLEASPAVRRRASAGGAGVSPASAGIPKGSGKGSPAGVFGDGDVRDERSAGTPVAAAAELEAALDDDKTE